MNRSIRASIAICRRLHLHAATDRIQWLPQVVEATTPDGFTHKVIEETGDYLYVEYESPTFGVSSGRARVRACGNDARPFAALPWDADYDF